MSDESKYYPATDAEKDAEETCEKVLLVDNDEDNVRRCKRLFPDFTTVNTPNGPKSYIKIHNEKYDI